MLCFPTVLVIPLIFEPYAVSHCRMHHLASPACDPCALEREEKQTTDELAARGDKPSFFIIQ